MALVTLFWCPKVVQHQHVQRVGRKDPPLLVMDRPTGKSADPAVSFKTVLVVDDDADTRASLRELLEGHGYRVQVAANGELALDYCHSNSPDCIILDLWMPVMDGWQLADALKRAPFAPTPIVVVTAGK